MWIVRFALRFPHTFYVLASLILFLGITTIVSMPTDIFPEINIPVVSVIWQYTGLSTPEMEQRITTYAEYSISSNVNGIKDLEGQTLSGITVQGLHRFEIEGRNIREDHPSRGAESFHGIFGKCIRAADQPTVLSAVDTPYQRLVRGIELLDALVRLD